MTTPSSDITDLFFTRINDYRLDTIYTSSGSSALNVYVEPWIMDAVSDFEDFCDQDLTYVVSTNTVEGYFVQDLNQKNKLMISKLMTKYWLGKSIKDVLQFNLVVSDRDFKTFSAAQNLKAKQDYYNSLQEELSQDLMNYAYKRNDWAGWKNQQFDN
jgi:hypothetical protein